MALDICHVLTGGSETLVLDGAYHGHTQSLISLSTYKMKQQLNSVSPRIKPSPNVWVVCVAVVHGVWLHVQSFCSVMSPIHTEASIEVKMLVLSMLKMLVKKLQAFLKQEKRYA